MSGEPKPHYILDRLTVQAVVVFVAILLLAAVVFSGLYIAITTTATTDTRIQQWQIVATFVSGFVTGILSAYGIFKAK